MGKKLKTPKYWELTIISCCCSFNVAVVAGILLSCRSFLSRMECLDSVSRGIYNRFQVGCPCRVTSNWGNNNYVVTVSTLWYDFVRDLHSCWTWEICQFHIFKCHVYLRKIENALSTWIAICLRSFQYLLCACSIFLTSQVSCYDRTKRGEKGKGQLLLSFPVIFWREIWSCHTERWGV